MATILHCDANNFYASVEIMLNPALKGVPVAVCGNPEKRHGIVLAKSEQAKKAGVKTGEPLWQAKQKCPNIVFVAPHYDDYVAISNKLFAMYSEYTDKVEPFGIDECWLDCTESTNLFGSGEEIAETLRKRVKKEIGITISVGVSFTKIFAKLGSDFKKPDAVTVIDKNNYKDIIWGLPVSDLLMVGRKTAKLFKQLSINTIGDLAKYDGDTLQQYIGINGKKLLMYANGIETEEIRLAEQKHIPESVGNSTTTPFDMTNISEAEAVLTSLAEMVAVRLRKYNLVANGIGVSIRYCSLDGTHKNNLLPYSTCNASDIAEEAVKLLETMHNFKKDPPIRQLGVYTYKLTGSDVRQTSIFDTPHSKRENLDKSIDKIRTKYGTSILKSGIVLKHEDLCDGLVDKDFQPFKK
ncbi:MAG: DNA polymerase IV [Clostridia bacterium]|nr:DNA polymerase IV [Clostridia bacterium]